ncbi:hypothetical protein TWF481_008426 [Arthrobotrys musiformis]|uniref:Uncharacterized protein n=1 Tax=Arthrobotrys musiformis TaxID=47236 RepID=A0AAV9W8L1_9PEZI
MGLSIKLPAVARALVVISALQILYLAAAKPVEIFEVPKASAPSKNQAKSLAKPDAQPSNSDDHDGQAQYYNSSKIAEIPAINGTLPLNSSIDLQTEKRAGLERPVNLPGGFYIADMIVECQSPQYLMTLSPADYEAMDYLGFVRMGRISHYPNWAEFVSSRNIEQILEFFWAKAAKCQECHCLAGIDRDGRADRDGVRFALERGDEDSECPTDDFALKCMLWYQCMCKEFLFYGGDPMKGQRTGRLHYGYGKGKYLRGPAGRELTAIQKGLFGGGATLPRRKGGSRDLEELRNGESFLRALTARTKKPYHLEGPESGMGWDLEDTLAAVRNDFAWDIGQLQGSSRFLRKKRDDGEEDQPDEATALEFDGTTSASKAQGGNDFTPNNNPVDRTDGPVDEQNK